MKDDNYQGYVETAKQFMEDDPEAFAEILISIDRLADELMNLNRLPRIIERKTVGEKIKAEIAEIFLSHEQGEETPQQMGWVGSDGLP